MKKSYLFNILIFLVVFMAPNESCYAQTGIWSKILKRAFKKNPPIQKNRLVNIDSIIRTIEIQENEILDYEIALRTRYLFIASTERLKNMGIVLRNDWRRPRQKRKIDLTKIDLKQFSIIDYEYDTIIKIPDDNKIRSIVTHHKEPSRNIDESENAIYINNKSEFWEISSILIIETE